MSETLIEQLKPYATEAPEVWALELGQKVTFGTVLGQSLKDSFSLKNKIKTDSGIFHTFPTKLGLAAAVLYYSVNLNLPIDFAIQLNHNIPCAGYVRKNMGVVKPPAWVMPEGCEDFAEALNQMKGKHGSVKGKFLKYSKEWEVEVGTQKQQVPYTMQLIPTGDGQCIFLYKRPIKIGAFNMKKSKFFVEEFMDLAAWLDSTLAAFNYQGDPTPADIPVPTWTLLAFPETEPLYEDKGKILEW
jgi:hypothetical protein